MIRIHLSALLGKKRWTQAKLAQVTDIRPTTISELYREMATRVTLEHFDLICEALDCTLEELVTFEPNKIPKIERNHEGKPIRPVKD